MATTVHGDITGQFVVVSSGAVDIANVTAVAAVNTNITVTMPDGTTSPLMSTDLIVPIPPATLEAGITVQGAVYLSATQVTLRVTNGSAGAIDPASQAAGNWQFLVNRR